MFSTEDDSKMKKKMIPDLRFAIAINSDLSEYEIVTVLKDILQTANSISAIALKHDVNMIVVYENSLFDFTKVHDEVDWLYYKHELSVFPLEDSTLLYQRDFANTLLIKIRECGFLAERICDDDFL